MFFHKLFVSTLNWAIAMVEPDIQPEIDFAVGGQAVIEGVMMRSPKSMTIAVRNPQGQIVVKRDHYQTICQRYPKLDIPIVRGVINLFEMMFIGSKAINWSAEKSIIDEETPKKQKKKSKVPAIFSKILEGLFFVFSLAVGLAFSLFLFKFLPLGITSFLDAHVSLIHNNFFIFNLVDGLLKATIFLSYIYILSLIPSFRRVFEYHGSEHKSIFTYEKKKELIPENAIKQSRFHPRCGTSFIIIVFAISVLAYTIVPKQETFLANFALRLTFLPLIAGLSYEALKISAKYQDSWFIKPLIAPGLAFQRLTTQEPDAKQVEVGLQSLKAALAMEKA